MKCTLILAEPTIGSATNDTAMDILKNPTQWRVGGLPPGEEAQIGRHPDPTKWSILRRIGSIQGNWEGSYDTAEEALKALEAEVNG